MKLAELKLKLERDCDLGDEWYDEDDKLGLLICRSGMDEFLSHWEITNPVRLWIQLHDLGGDGRVEGKVDVHRSFRYGWESSLVLPNSTVDGIGELDDILVPLGRRKVYVEVWYE